MDILSALKSEASKLEQRLDSLNSAIKVFGGRNSVSYGNGRKKKRHMSAAGRRAIARAQRLRWKKIKAEK